MQFIIFKNKEGKETGEGLPYFTEFFPFSHTMNIALLQWQLDKMYHEFKIKPVDWMTIDSYKKDIPQSFQMLIRVSVGFSISSCLMDPVVFTEELNTVLENRQLSWLAVMAQIRLYYGKDPKGNIQEHIDHLKTELGHDVTFLQEALDNILKIEGSKMFTLKILEPKVKIEMKPVSSDLDILELQMIYQFQGKQLHFQNAAVLEYVIHFAKQILAFVMPWKIGFRFVHTIIWILPVIVNRFQGG